MRQAISSLCFLIFVAFASNILWWCGFCLQFRLRICRRLFCFCLDFLLRLLNIFYRQLNTILLFLRTIQSLVSRVRGSAPSWRWSPADWFVLTSDSAAADIFWIFVFVFVYAFYPVCIIYACLYMSLVTWNNLILFYLIITGSVVGFCIIATFTHWDASLFKIQLSLITPLKVICNLYFLTILIYILYFLYY